jgi:hypothetical protein
MRAITSVTLATFLLHMWLGCCAHHVHASASSCQHDSANTPACLHVGHSQDHANESAHNELPERVPPRKGRCSDTDCVFLTVGKTELAKLPTVGILLFSTYEKVAADRTPSDFGVMDLGGDVGPPVRLYLLNRVLLI